MSDTQELVQDELATLKERADRMGLSYHPSIGVDKLRDKVSAALSDAPVPAATSSAPVVIEVVQETLAQQRHRQKQHASELVRIRLTCMNPAKKDWEGEIFTVGNSLVGTVKKYVPFNADEGWHVPRILLDTLQDRQCQIFIKGKTKHGVTMSEGKLIKEFAIEILPQLTPEELHDLAQRQAMAGAID